MLLWDDERRSYRREPPAIGELFMLDSAKTWLVLLLVVIISLIGIPIFESLSIVIVALTVARLLGWRD